MILSSPPDWKRKASLGSSHVRLVGRMVAKGHTPEYAERIFK
jgi:error-prone DNA polymerase